MSAAGDKPTAAEWDALKPLWALKLFNETVNGSSTLQNDDELFVAVEANATYRVTCHLIQNSGATPGFKLDLTLPSGASWKQGTFRCGSSAANLQTGVMSSNSISGITGAGVDAFVDFEAALSIGVTPGTVALRWAQNTSNASNTIVGAGSYLMLQRTA